MTNLPPNTKDDKDDILSVPHQETSDAYPCMYNSDNADDMLLLDTLNNFFSVAESLAESFRQMMKELAAVTKEIFDAIRMWFEKYSIRNSFSKRYRSHMICLNRMANKFPLVNRCRSPPADYI